MRHIRAALLALVLAGVAALVGAPNAQAAVDRVCMSTTSATGAEIIAYQWSGAQVFVRRNQCSSSTSDLRSFYVGSIPCMSPWGYLYAKDTTYDASAVHGDLVLTCR